MASQKYALHVQVWHQIFKGLLNNYGLEKFVSIKYVSDR